MIDHCSMELLRSSTALTDLEIKRPLTSMCDCFHRLCKENSRLLQFTYTLPVSSCRAGFHLDKWFPLQRSHQIMIQSIIISCVDRIFFMPCRVSIPGNDINFFCNLKIVQPFIMIHEICCCRKIASTIPHCLNFMMEEIRSLMGNKSFPVQI